MYEIVEAHHHKVDAFWLAIGMADAIADATDRTRDDYNYGRSGHTGARRKAKSTSTRAWATLLVTTRPILLAVASVTLGHVA